MESAGAVCLPAAGYRSGNPNDGDTVNADSVKSVGGIGIYWSSTPSDYTSAYHLYFKSSYVNLVRLNDWHFAYAVRLVTEYQSEPSAE